MGEQMDWRKLFGNSTEQTLDYFPPKHRDGNPVVLPPPEVLDAGISEWELSLVGQFLGATPNFSSLQRIVVTLWNKALQGSQVKVSSAGSNLFIFSFNSVSARDWVLENGPWHTQNKPLILRKWEPNLKKLSFNLARIPVWVHLYNVALELFNRAGLSYIASAIGVPLSIDSITASKSRLEYAKLCVEIGVNEVIPNYIEVVLKDGHPTSILVEIPWLPPSYRKCKVFGHSEKGCLHKQNPASTAPQVWKKKEVYNSDSGSPSIGGVELLQESQNSEPKLSEIQNQNPLNTVFVIDPDLNETKTDSKAQDDLKEHTEIQPTASVSEDLVDDGEKHLKDLNDSIEEEKLVTQKTTLKRGRGKPIKENSKASLVGSKNRFEVLTTVEENSQSANRPPRKVRTASLGVAGLVNELKSKKREHIDKAHSIVVEGNGGTAGSSSK
ncbi:uncharacterized protein LOC120180569 [Hibiscus syriacus]|uniref:uncharacterized protein LOC120180569 n=1 Tax=Hibiscus syriacus TaxID=106335 RepID=UPI0019233DB8|nr:uncharacterized protein LOC120180569 [Hibiscus syriacus]